MNKNGKGKERKGYEQNAECDKKEGKNRSHRVVPPLKTKEKYIYKTGTCEKEEKCMPKDGERMKDIAGAFEKDEK